MKLIFSFLFLIPSLAWAQPTMRMDGGNSYCIFPQNGGFDETFSTGADPVISVTSVSVTGYCSSIKIVREDYVNHPEEITVVNPSVRCDMIIPDGTRFSTSDWEASIVVEDDGADEVSVTHKLICRSGL